MRRLKKVCVLAATGMLGTGFSEKTFYKALANNPDVICCDAGSSDPGPYYLGEGVPMSSREAVKRDLRLMICSGIKHGIPVLVGSAGTAGGNPHLYWTVDIVKEIAAEEKLHFKLAVIESEISKEQLLRYKEQGKVKGLYPYHDLTEDTIEEIVRIVGAMGPEPYIKAVEEGAQVVIAGRSSDTSIFAAIPIMKGLDNGATWHAAKVLECGAGCVEQRLYPDCMVAWIKDDSFRVEPPNEDMRCTPVSVVSHSLYENVDPYNLLEPAGVLDTSASTYHQDGERAVIVNGSKFIKTGKYTIKIEGVQKSGYRQIAIGGIKDPVVLKQLDIFLEEVKRSIQRKVFDSTGIVDSNYKLQFRIYGNQDSHDKPNVGIVIEVLGRTEQEAHSIMSIAWHTALHHPVKEWSGLVSQIAFPYSPPNINAGVAYQFCLNHVIEVNDPLELFPISLMDL